ncbi:MAG: hypothetical protein H7A52_12720 [Akkermansiaceae bacterium]|nr:hypothetical protein [Akkermansiaceae bacterium]
MILRSLLPLALLVSGAPLAALADGAKDNIPADVRRIPPVGVEVPEADRLALEKGIADLGAALEGLKMRAQDAKNHPGLDVLIPDAEIYHKAARYALTGREFHKEGEIKLALDQLATGLERAHALEKGEAPWTRQTGNVVRGYRSKIDGSAQPYGLEVPADYDFEGTDGRRLDFWFHGRGETLSEVNFIQQRANGSGGKIKPPGAIVLHPYGRYSNANKFAGEIDSLEALAHARLFYRIDEDRVFVRGFSMGGAACWQFAVHYAERWAGAQPGAGFAETREFLRVFQDEPVSPPWWEQKLWHWYDCTDWVINLTNLPTIAYSGELDRQKQAADMMEKAAADENMRLVHLIGPGMQHQLHPDTLAEMERRLAAIAAAGRERVPMMVRFQTYTLRYPTMHWVTVDAMTEHWEAARVEASLWLPSGLSVSTSGVAAFSLHFGAGECPLDPVGKPAVEIDGQKLQAPAGVFTDRSWDLWAAKGDDGKWTLTAEAPATGGLVKKHGLQGPIDDAFMDSFLMVGPTGKPLNEKIGAWAAAEMNHAVTEWQRHYRGDARVKKDTEITDADLAAHNLVLWGDPSSNAVLAKIADKLPIHWTAAGIVAGDQKFDAAGHALAMIYPNPLNPERYVVLNSGFTFREYDYLNNARQVPKLPDWAVIDITQPVTSQYPGGIPAAGFFGEKWEWKAEGNR